jgi:two-component system, response regulator PdtaR
MEPVWKRSKSMKALRVLVVEDEMLIGMLLADKLGAMGYDVCAVEATETGAVAAAARCNPDLMIVDARLRDGSGVSAVAEILRSGWVPHVFVSGDTATIRALRPGAIVIQKPFRDIDLDRAIQRALKVLPASPPKNAPARSG